MSSHVLLEMLNAYSYADEGGAAIALREVMQSVCLLALARSNFFNHAAFYSGTALRLLYGLRRGSEDMVFSLLEPDMSFDLNDYAGAIENEFLSYGLKASFARKEKHSHSNIQSAFLKSNTQQQLLTIGLDADLSRMVNPHSQLKIKVEVDVQPPGGFNTEIKYLYQPVPFAVRSFTLPSLLAGKLHAVLYRSWKNRVKGRDWYDLLWYAGQHPDYDISHLETRARQSGDYAETVPMTGAFVYSLLLERLDGIDLAALKADVLPFLRDGHELDAWSKDMFQDAFKRLKGI